MKILNFDWVSNIFSSGASRWILEIDKDIKKKAKKLRFSQTRRKIMCVWKKNRKYFNVYQPTGEMIYKLESFRREKLSFGLPPFRGARFITRGRKSTAGTSVIFAYEVKVFKYLFSYISKSYSNFRHTVQSSRTTMFLLQSPYIILGRTLEYYTQIHFLLFQ